MSVHGFEDASRRLLHLARGRIQSGEVSERRLAKLAGASQPHLHNVLAGHRGLANGVADRILDALGLSLPELLAGAEPAAAALARLEGPLGGGRGFPRIVASPPARFVDAERLRRLEEPCLAKVAPEETAMIPTLFPGDDVLLDCGWEARRRLRGDAVYAIEWEGSGYLCRCRVTESALLTLVQSESAARPPARIALEGGRVDKVVRGRVVWFGRDLGGPGLPQRG